MSLQKYASTAKHVFKTILQPSGKRGANFDRFSFFLNSRIVDYHLVTNLKYFTYKLSQTISLMCMDYLLSFHAINGWQ